MAAILSRPQCVKSPMTQQTKNKYAIDHIALVAITKTPNLVP